MIMSALFPPCNIKSTFPVGIAGDTKYKESDGYGSL